MKRSKKRQKLIETAETLFKKYGAKRITVREICEKANVSKMTFYKYFDNKQDMINTIRDLWISKTFEAFDRINAKDIPFPEKIDLMTKWKVAFAQNTNQEFIREISQHDEIYDIIKEGYLKNIEKAQKNGEIRNDIDPEFYWMIVNKISEIYKDGSWKKIFDDAGEYQRQLRTILFYGILKR